MNIRIHPGPGYCAFGLEIEPPPEGSTNTTFFTIHASPFGQEVVLYLRLEDQRKLFETLGDRLFNEEREITE